MCIHDESLTYRMIKRYHEERKPRRAAIFYRRPNGDLIGSWFCDPLDERQVARVMQELQEWHPDENGWMDLWHVNDVRARYYEYALTEDDIALWQGDTAKSAKHTAIAEEVSELLKNITGAELQYA